MKKTILDSFTEAQEVINQFTQDPQNITAIEKAAQIMVRCIQEGGKIISCGNGGSHCDAMHFAEEMTGRFREERGPLPAVAIADATHITCAANDYGFESIFSRYIAALGKKEDVLLAVTTSGNSPNVIKAVEAAKSVGMKTVLLSGKDGGKLAQKADVEIRISHHGYSDRIQEMHIKIIHILIQLIEEGVSA